MLVLIGIIIGFDFDLNTNQIYYGDRDDSSIWGVSITKISTFQDNRYVLVKNTTVWDLCYDWINHLLYWTDDKYVC